MQQPPPTIPLSAIAWGNHVKRDDEIELLADSIRLKGLIHPIILSPLPDGTYLLEDGGRRLQAVEFLGYKELKFGATTVRDHPGYVLQEHVANESDSYMTELIANLHRIDPDWREQLRLLVKGYRTAKREATLANEELSYATFGKMVGGLGYSDIQAAVAIHDDVFANPEKYKDCTTIKAAYAKKLKDAQNAVAEALKQKMLRPQVGFVRIPVAVLAGPEPRQEGPAVVDSEIFRADGEPSTPIINLTSHFRHCDSLSWMSSMPPASFDHIVCDPDFGISEERLNANMNDAGEGIAQENVRESLYLLSRFFPLAFRVMRDRGFLVLWMDQEHNEKLSAMGVAAGFRVQRWMFIWHKADHNSNANPRANFTKDYETALIFSKPGSTLAKYPTKSVFSFPSGNIAKQFGHPFAKPVEVWKKLLQAVANPGESVYDPFMGSGSSVIAAVRCGLRANGSEIQEQHFNSAIANLRKEYVGTLGEGVRFE